jgi:membrane protein insertase Oxa1/YidC/SpoIIIJ
MIIVIGSAITQYYSSKQLLPVSKNSKGLRAILKDANKGTKTDQSDVTAAVGNSTRYFIPVLIFLFTVSIASALSLYWFVGGLMAFLQQSYILRKDETEMEKSPTTNKDRVVVKSEVVSSTKPAPAKTKKNKKAPSKNKRRKK